MAEISQRAHSEFPQGCHFEGQTIRDQARVHLGHSFNYNTSYQRSQSSLFGGLFDRRKRNAALLDAAAHGYIHRLQAQLRAGAHVDHTDKNKWTALHYAAYGGFRDCVVTLLEAGSNINALDSMSRTPLFIAIERKKIDAALCLISTQGINLELILTSKFITAEASRQNIEMSAILEEHLSRLRESELICDPISLAIMQGHLGIIRSIFDHNKVLALDLMRRQLTNLEHMYWSSASIAIVFGHASILRWLLSQQLVKADGSACGGTYLVSAVKSGNIECLQILLENGATWNTRKSSLDQDRLLESLGHATKRGDLDMMQYLIKSGADVNAQWVARDSRFLRSNTKRHKRSALHVAAAYDQADAAELLMNHGCNVDDNDSNGWTALMHAAYWGCASVAQVLVVYHANPWLKDRHGSTAQDFAIAQQYSRVTPTTKNGHSRIVDLIRRVV